MKLSIVGIVYFMHIALTAQITLTSTDSVEVQNQNTLIGRGRMRRDSHENKVAQEYYKLLRNLQTHNSSSKARTGTLSIEDASAVNKYISKFLESQVQGENELHLDPIDIPKVLELLGAHQQHFTTVNSNEIPIPSVPDPNEYAQVPYIPAIHGIHSTSTTDNENTLSHISLLQDAPSHDSISGVTVETDTRLTPTQITAAANSITTSLTSCRASLLCGVALAAAITAATVGAVAFPVLVAGPLLSNRKKRSSDNFELQQDNILDIINSYNANQNPLLPGHPIPELSEFLNQQIGNDAIELKPSTQNVLTESDKEINQLIDNKTPKNITHDNTYGSNNESSWESIAGERGMHISADQIHNLKNAFFNSRLTSQPNDNIVKDDGLEKADRGFQITTNFTLEHRIPNVNNITSTKDNLSHRLRSNLYDFFSQFDHLSEMLNISTRYEKKSNNSGINNEQQSILGILDYYLKNNSTRLNANIFNNNKPNIGNSSPDPKDSSKDPEVSYKIPADPYKTISSTHLFQNLILNNQRQEFKETTTEPSTTLPPVHPTVTKETALIEDNLHRDLLQLLTDYIKIKHGPSTQDNSNSFSTNPLPQKAQFTEKPLLVNNVVIPSSPNFQGIQPEADLFNTQPQNIIPIKTVNGILQNPPASPQNLNLILTKLPALINDPIKQQFQHSPIVSNQKQYSQFSPTVLQQNFQSSLGPYQGATSVVQLRPPTVSSENTYYQPSSGNQPQRLSPEIRKFYGLLCKAILEPDVPLNKVTAYIAEKCLVMRFTGILKA